jgi:5-methylcytosine-specific restriction endonuclease McrA
MKIISRADAKRAGLKRYRTGAPCKHGHVAERYVGSCECCECADEKRRRFADYYTQYREEHREVHVVYCKDYYDAHAEGLRQYAKDYRESNIETVREKDRERQSSDARKATRVKHYEKHGDKIRDRENRRYLRETARIQARVKRYRDEHPEKVRESNRAGDVAAKARKKGAPGKFKKADIKRMLVAQNFICAACPADILKNYQVDHIHPLRKGGSNWPDNLQLLCPPCNQSKGAKTMAEWIAWKAALQAPLAPLLPALLSAQNDVRDHPAARLLPPRR